VLVTAAAVGRRNPPHRDRSRDAVSIISRHYGRTDRNISRTVYIGYRDGGAAARLFSATKKQKQTCLSPIEVVAFRRVGEQAARRCATMRRSEEFSIGRGSILAAGALTIGLMAVGATAQAASLEKDGNVATAIRNLVVGSVTIDVEFSCNISTKTTYGDPPDFEITTPQDTSNVVDSINNVLNDDGSVYGVGCNSSDFSPAIYRLAFNEDIISVPIPLSEETVDARVLVIYEGVTGDNNEGKWARASEEPDFFPFGDDSVVPVLIRKSSGGQGNQAPAAEAGGPYTGGVGVPVQFNGGGSDDFDGSISAYNWKFGDGGTAKGKKPKYTYGASGPYNVTLTVTDNKGAKSSDTTEANIGQSGKPPVADAGGPYNAAVGKKITFNGGGSNDQDGSISKYSWEFGDGATGKGKKPTHKYNSAGQYTVKLTVTDNDGNADSDSANATAGNGGKAPTADAGGRYFGDEGTTVQFNGGGSEDPDGTISSYSWSFGDGNTGKGKTPTHRYNLPGDYVVTLTVTDNDGNADSANTQALIGD
jgi:PKD repeat protein